MTNSNKQAARSGRARKRLEQASKGLVLTAATAASTGAVAEPVDVWEQTTSYKFAENPQIRDTDENGPRPSRTSVSRTRIGLVTAETGTSSLQFGFRVERVPEPTVPALLGLGLLAMGVSSRGRRH